MANPLYVKYLALAVPLVSRLTALSRQLPGPSDDSAGAADFGIFVATYLAYSTKLVQLCQ